MLILVISCNKKPQKQLQTFIQPYLKAEYKHFLIVPQIYCRNCIKTLFGHVKEKKLKNEVGILLLEINTHTEAEIPENILTTKYSDYYKTMQDKNTDLIWIRLENNKIKEYQKLNSKQFYEKLPLWIK